MKNDIYDIAVVGSGPSGVHAAYPLIEAGLHVAIIDGGLDSKTGDIFEKTNQILKIQSNIKINQSLGKGGLSEVWPGICDYFTKEELKLTGLPADEIFIEYKEISKLINLKTKPPLDIHGKSILEASNKVYRLPVTFPYRTSSVINDFKKHKNFTYIPNQIVLEAKDKKAYAEIHCLFIDEKVKSIFKTKYIILAAGSINSTRILLRSFNLYNKKVPFLTKTYYSIVCLNLKSIAKKIKPIKNCGQVAISNSEFFIQFYKCNPLSLSKAFPKIPVIKLFSPAVKSLAPYLVIADARFPAVEGNKKFLQLKKQSGEDILKITFQYSKNELSGHSIKLNKIKKKLIKFGLIPLKIVKGDVTSHYANGIPIQDKPGILSTDEYGKLHQAGRIYVADSSTWRMLPTKPPTLTIMANAARIGKQVLKKFQ